MPSLHTSLKSQLLAVSARSLKLCDSITDLRISFDKLHKIHKRATPEMMMEYRLALQLYKLFNLESPNCMVCRYMRTPLHKREGGNSIINFMKNVLVSLVLSFTLLFWIVIFHTLPSCLPGTSGGQAGNTFKFGPINVYNFLRPSKGTIEWHNILLCLSVFPNIKCC